MTQLHIYKGSYGSITPAPDDFDGFPQVVFQVDEALAQCSPSLQALVRVNNPPVPAHEVTTIEADNEVIEAVKAMLARGLQGQWNRGYKQVLSTIDVRIAQGDPIATSVLGLAQAGGATLKEALHAEQEVANSGIERAVEQLNQVAPFWMGVHLKGVYISRDENGELAHSTEHELHPTVELSQPTPMSEWGDTNHAYAMTAQNETLEEGYYDVTCAVPFYLPVNEEGAPLKSQEVMDLVTSTPALRQAILDQASQKLVDYNSCTETTLEIEVSDDGEDEYGMYIEYEEDYDDLERDDLDSGRRFNFSRSRY